LRRSREDRPRRPVGRIGAIDGEHAAPLPNGHRKEARVITAARTDISNTPPLACASERQYFSWMTQRIALAIRVRTARIRKGSQNMWRRGRHLWRLRQHYPRNCSPRAGAKHKRRRDTNQYVPHVILRRRWE
jgi:hypothetical protein